MLHAYSGKFAIKRKRGMKTFLVFEISSKSLDMINHDISETKRLCIISLTLFLLKDSSKVHCESD